MCQTNVKVGNRNRIPLLIRIQGDILQRKHRVSFYYNNAEGTCQSADSQSQQDLGPVIQTVNEKLPFVFFLYWRQCGQACLCELEQAALLKHCLAGLDRSWKSMWNRTVAAQGANKTGCTVFVKTGHCSLSACKQEAITELRHLR